MSSSNNDTNNNVWSTIFDKIKEKEVQIAQKVIFCFIIRCSMKTPLVILP